MIEWIELATYRGLWILFGLIHSIFASDTMKLIIEVSSSSLSWLLGGGGYFVLGSIFEENKLKSRFLEYKEYERNVGRFFPWNKRHLQYLMENK